MHQHSHSLPQPSSQEQSLSDQLLNKIQTEIALHKGVIRFDHYMNLVLYEPQLGYYRNGQSKFGTVRLGGDFVTAPAISPLFANSLAQPIIQTLKHLIDQGLKPVVLEFGAGEGLLAAQLLPILHEAVGKIHYQIIELSAELKQRQRQTIQTLVPSLVDQVCWLDQLPEKLVGVMLGNEVLDAMPIRLFQRQMDTDQWVELGVSLNEQNALTWDAMPTLDPPPHFKAVTDYLPSNIPYILEIHQQADAFMKSLGDCLEDGLIILVDYGFDDHQYYVSDRHQGTLMCHYRHIAHGDVFFAPGLQDITAHVNFSSLYASALEADLYCMGYTSQARFLLNAGLLDHLAKMSSNHAAKQQTLHQGVLTLISEAEMGELFKVIAFAKGSSRTLHLAGFTVGDQQARL